VPKQIVELFKKRIKIKVIKKLSKNVCHNYISNFIFKNQKFEMFFINEYLPAKII